MYTDELSVMLDMFEAITRELQEHEYSDDEWAALMVEYDRIREVLDVIKERLQSDLIEMFEGPWRERGAAGRVARSWATNTCHTLGR
ncbi:MAG: hypothetical protein JWL73_3264 [Actinomycetia bacterium]|nr:hypothetical protein [Actinomycetes bacterium]